MVSIIADTSDMWYHIPLPFLSWLVDDTGSASGSGSDDWYNLLRDYDDTIGYLRDVEDYYCKCCLSEWRQMSVMAYHLPLDCLLITGPLWHWPFLRGLHRWTPLTKASNAENITISWRQHAVTAYDTETSIVNICCVVLNHFSQQLYWTQVI